MRALLFSTAALMVIAGSAPVFADAQEQREYERSAAHSRAARDRGYDERRGGAYVDEMRRLLDRLGRNQGGHPRSGGVGDQTGHSAHMGDKAKP